MQWETMGFKDEPFKTQPITAYTLDLYTGNKEKIKQSQFVLNSNNLIMVIEGSRGIGTTSFGNCLRFNAQADRKYFTPTSEIRVEPNWNADTLMAAIIANIVSTLELQFFNKVKNKPKFKEAKAVIQRVTETYRSFGASIFGFGGNYDQSGNTSQPMVMPTQVLAHHLENLVDIIYGLNFKYGILLQLSNLDVGVVQNETHLKGVLNVMRDYFQINGTSWLLIGDRPLRRFIAQEVDRVDDIIAFETDITPLSESDYLAMIKKRVEYFRINPKVKLPVAEEVLLYLYQVTKGRLRYIFGLLARLFNILQPGTLSDQITLELAKPIIVDCARERIARYHLTNNEELVLKQITKKEGVQVGEIARALNKNPSYISTILSQMQKYKLVSYDKQWRHHYYHASIDACIAYSGEE